MLVIQERRKDKKIARFFSVLEEPKKFVQLRRSDHYDAAQILGLVFYDRGVMRQLVDEIMNWVDKRT